MGNAQAVVSEGEEQVLADVTHGIATQEPRLCDATQVALHQGDTGAFPRHVGTGAHGDTHVGPCQGGSVVNAVTSLSPVSMTVRMPASCSRQIASGVESLIGSATPRTPAA